MKKDLSRTEDKQIYLSENRYKDPKEATKFILKESSKYLTPGVRVADIGCAAGEFLFHLNDNYPDIELYGFDVVPELIEKARTMVPKANFQTGSLLERSMAPSNHFDVIYVQGVLSIFDEIEPLISNLVEWSKPGGRIFVFGMLNEYDVDVLMKYQKSEFAEGHWEKGWNLFSQSTYRKFFSKNNSRVENFKRFALPIDLEFNGDPARTWSIKQNDGSRLVRNGLGQIVDLFLTEVSVNSSK